MSTALTDVNTYSEQESSIVGMLSCSSGIFEEEGHIPLSDGKQGKKKKLRKLTRERRQ